VTAPFQGPRAPFGGRPGSGGDSTLTFTTVAAMVANVPTARTVAVNLDPMFGPAGGRFVFNVALGAWVPETTVRIYGTGVGTVYTAAAGDINTDVQVGSFPTIPISILPNGTTVSFNYRATRSSAGAAGNVSAKLMRNPTLGTIAAFTFGQNADQNAISVGQMYANVLRRGNGSIPAGVVTPNTYLPISGGYDFTIVFNAPTVNMIQTLLSLYIDISFGGNS